MAKKKKKKVVKSRDIFIEAIIKAQGGVVRIFQDKKKKSKNLRKVKHKKQADTE